MDDLRQFDVIRFAQKACSNIAILNLCRQKGVVVDAVSGFRNEVRGGEFPGPEHTFQ